MMKTFKFQAIFSILLIVVPIISYSFLVVYFSTNIPFWDDYDSILVYINTPDIFRQQQLFSQHNEHRIALTRLIAQGYYILFGEIDFRYLIYTGNMALLFLFLGLFQLFRGEKLSIVLFIPIAYLLFQSQSWENMIWATGSLQNYYVLLFALLATYCWHQRTQWGYGLALGFGIIATYTSGNGLLIFFVLLVWECDNILASLELTSSHKRKFLLKEHGQLWGLLAVTICIGYLYFKGYQKPAYHPDMREALLQPVLLARYVGILLGSYIEHMGKTIVFGVGFIEIAIFIFLMYNRYDRQNPVVYYFLAFHFLSVFTVALGRAGFGTDQALSSRYRVLAIMVLILEYWAVIESYPKVFIANKLVIYCLIILAIAFNIASTKIGVQSLSARKNMLIQGITAWKETGEGLSYHDSERASQLLKQSIRKGLYRPPSLLPYIRGN